MTRFHKAEKTFPTKAPRNKALDKITGRGRFPVGVFGLFLSPARCATGIASLSGEIMEISEAVAQSRRILPQNIRVEGIFLESCICSFFC